MKYIKKQAAQLKEEGYEVLAPMISEIKTGENGFIIFEKDKSNNPIIIESDFIENCLKSEKILVCNQDGYVGNTVMFEIGYLLAKKKRIEFMQIPSEAWLMEIVDYYLETSNSKSLIKKKTKKSSTK